MTKGLADAVLERLRRLARRAVHEVDVQAWRSVATETLESPVGGGRVLGSAQRTKLVGNPTLDADAGSVHPGSGEHGDPIRGGGVGRRLDAEGRYVQVDAKTVGNHGEQPFQMRRCEQRRDPPPIAPWMTTAPAGSRSCTTAAWRSSAATKAASASSVGLVVVNRLQNPQRISQNGTWR